MERIPQRYLEDLIERINEVTSSPAMPYTKTKIMKANIGNYHLSFQNKVVSTTLYQLVRTVSKAGKTQVVSRSCYVSKRELYFWLQAFLAGHAT